MSPDGAATAATAILLSRPRLCGILMVSNSVGDVRDNCPTLANPCQEDSDANVCDIFPDGFESGDTTARSKHRWQLAEKIAVKPFHDRPELPSVG